MNASFYIYDMDIEDWVSGLEINLLYNPTTLAIPRMFNRNRNLWKDIIMIYIYSI